MFTKEVENAIKNFLIKKIPGPDDLHIEVYPKLRKENMLPLKQFFRKLRQNNSQLILSN